MGVDQGRSTNRVHTSCTVYRLAYALFNSENFLVFDTVAISFLVDKYYPIME